MSDYGSTRQDQTQQSFIVPKIRLKRDNKLAAKGIIPGQLPGHNPESGHNPLAPQTNYDGHPEQAMTQEQQELNQAVNKFFYEQTKDKIAAEKKDQEKREQDAAKNQLSKAQQDMKSEKCLECEKSDCLVYKQHEGTKVCRNCGVVQQSSMIDQTNEKRNFSSELASADHGTNRIQMRNPGMFPNDTIVIHGNSAEAKNLKTYAMNKHDGYERNLKEGNTKIKLLAESLNLNHADVKHLAQEYLKKIEDSKVLKGKSLDAKVGCVMFYAARSLKKHRKPQQILNYVTSNEREMSKCFKKCKDLLKFVAITPDHVVETTCQKLNLPYAILQMAKTTARNFSTHALCEGRRPQTIAGVSLFMVLAKHQKYKNCQAEMLEKVANCVSITQGTIRDTYQHVLPHQDKLLPEMIQDQGTRQQQPEPKLEQRPRMFPYPQGVQSLQKRWGE